MGSSTRSSPALPLQGRRSILQGRLRPGTGDAELTMPTLWARRGDMAQPPEELPIGMPLALQGEGRHVCSFPVPCTCRGRGQSHPNRLGLRSRGRALVPARSLVAACPSCASSVRARGDMGPQLSTWCGSEPGQQGWLRSEALRQRGVMARSC